MDENTKGSIVHWFGHVGKERTATEFFNAIPEVLEQIDAREKELAGKKPSNVEDKKQVDRAIKVLIKTRQELERLK